MTHRALITQMLDALAIADNIALVGAAYTQKSVDLGLRKMRDAAEAARKYLAAPEQSEPAAWCELSIGGKSIAYFDGKPIIMTGKVGNDCHTTPLYTHPAPKAEPVNQMLLDALKCASTYVCGEGTEAEIEQVERAIAQAEKEMK